MVFATEGGYFGCVLFFDNAAVAIELLYLVQPVYTDGNLGGVNNTAVVAGGGEGGGWSYALSQTYPGVDGLKGILSTAIS